MTYELHGGGTPLAPRIATAKEMSQMVLLVINSSWGVTRKALPPAGVYAYWSSVCGRAVRIVNGRLVGKNSHGRELIGTVRRDAKELDHAQLLELVKYGARWRAEKEQRQAKALERLDADLNRIGKP